MLVTLNFCPTATQLWLGMFPLQRLQMTAFPNFGRKDLKMDLSGYKTGFLHKATYAFALNF